MNKKLMLWTSLIILITLNLICISSYGLSEEEKDSIPYGFPVNNSTKIVKNNDTYWVSTEIDLDNWSISDFFDPDDLLPQPSISSEEVEQWIDDLDKSRKSLNETKNKLDSLSGERKINNIAFVIYLIVMFSIILFLVVAKLNQRNKNPPDSY